MEIALTLKCSISVPCTLGVEACRRSKRRLKALVRYLSSMHKGLGEAAGLIRDKEFSQGRQQ